MELNLNPCPLPAINTVFHGLVIFDSLVSAYLLNRVPLFRLCLQCRFYPEVECFGKQNKTPKVRVVNMNSHDIIGGMIGSIFSGALRLPYGVNFECLSKLSVIQTSIAFGF